MTRSRRRSDLPVPAADAEVYTCGEVARLLGCSAKSAQKYFDAGLLKGYRLPNGTFPAKPGDRRVPREALEAFAAGVGIRLPWQRVRRVLAVGCAAPAGCEPADAAGAGAAAARGELAGVLVGCDGGLDAAVGVARTLARVRPGLTLGLLLPPDRAGADVPGGLFAAVYRDGDGRGFAGLARGG